MHALIYDCIGWFLSRGRLLRLIAVKEMVALFTDGRRLS